MWRRVSGAALPCARRSLCSSSGAASANNPLGAVSGPDDIPTLKLYRDCIKLTYHIAAHSAKGDAMRKMIRESFRAQAHVEDPKEIGRLKMLAIVGLQNYVIHEQTGKALEKKRRNNPSAGRGAAGDEKKR